MKYRIHVGRKNHVGIYLSCRAWFVLSPGIEIDRALSKTLVTWTFIIGHAQFDVQCSLGPNNKFGTLDWDENLMIHTPKLPSWAQSNFVQPYQPLIVQLSLS